MSGILVVGLFLGVIIPVFGLMWYFSAEQKAKRVMLAEPLTPISGLVPGDRARVAGRVRLLDPLEAPLSGRDCAYWHVLVEEHRGKNSWYTVAQGDDSAPFLLADGGREVRVDPRRARMLVRRESAGHTGAFDPASDRERRLLQRLGVAPTSFLGLNRHFRFTEGRIDAGEAVAVLGTAQLREIGGATELLVEPGAEGELIVSDWAETRR